MAAAGGVSSASARRASPAASSRGASVTMHARERRRRASRWPRAQAQHTRWARPDRRHRPPPSRDARRRRLGESEAGGSVRMCAHLRAAVAVAQSAWDVLQNRGESSRVRATLAHTHRKGVV